MTIIDTNRRTTSRLDCLASEGVDTIIRYYARTTKQKEKRLTLDEAEAIIAAGMKVAIVCQSAGDKATYFSKETGLQDGVYARNYGASVIGQPQGSAIYFAVDYDTSPSEVEERVIPYFKAIKETFEPSPNLPEYSIGAYGNGAVCDALLKSGLVEYTWLSQSRGHYGHKKFKESKRWTLFQNMPSEMCGIGVDVDDLNPEASSMGAFAELVDANALIEDDVPVAAQAAAILATDPNADFVSWCNQQGFKHFKPYELLVMGGRNSNPQSPCYQKNTAPPSNLWGNIVQTVKMLDILRDRLNAPIRITSAYRSPAYNTCIGGAGQSAHLTFQALDFIAEGNSRPVDWARTLRSMRDDEDLFSGGVGLYAGFVHVDTNGVNRDW